VFSIIDLIAVADVEALLGAVSPDRVLNEPRKRPRKPAVELPGVDLLGNRVDDVSAAAGPVAGEAVGMVGPEPVQNASPVQEIVDQGIDGDHAAADLKPAAPAAWGAEEQDGPGHHQHLVGDAVDLFQRNQQRRSHSGQPVGSGLLGRSIQPPVDPAHEITISNVANKKVQRVGGLVQPTVAQPMIGQRAARQMIGLGAGVPGLVVPAVVKLPIASELRTTRCAAKIALNRLPSCQAMALHVVEGDLVGDALVAQYRDKPIEQDCRVPGADGRMNAFGLKRFTSISDKRGRASEMANPEDQRSCMVEGCMVLCPRTTARCREPDGGQIHLGQIIATSLRWASVSPSMYRCVVWIDR
jgi:hypothetical protein